MILKFIIIFVSVFIAILITYALWDSEIFKNDSPTWYKFYKIASKVCIIFVWIVIIFNAIILIRN